MKGRVGAILAGVLIIATSVVATGGLRPSGPALIYNVVVARTTPDHLPIFVSLTLPRASGDSVVFRGFASASVLRLRDVHVVDSKNQEIPFTLTYRQAPGSGDRVVPYVVARGIPSGPLRLHYLVDPTGRGGDSHVGHNGFRSSYSDSAFTLLSGRDILLAPTGLLSRGAVRAHFLYPKNWEMVNTLRRDPWAPGRWPTFADGWVAQGSRPSGLEQILATPLAFGPLHRDSFSVGGTRYRVAYLASTPQPFRELATARMRAVAGFLDAQFDRGLGKTYDIVALPAASDGDIVEGASAALGQAQTLLPLTPRRLRDFAVALARAYTRYEPTAVRLKRQEDHWLVDAVEEYLGWAALAAVDTAAAGAALEVLLDHLQVVTALDSPINLLKFYERDPQPGATYREVVAPAVFYGLLRWLELRGFREQSALLVRRLFEAPQSRGLSDLLKDLNRPALADSIARVFQGNTRLLLSAVSAPAIPEERRSDLFGLPVSDSLQIAATGMTHGYLENCGCKTSESGGLVRRRTELRRLASGRSPLLVLDAGSAMPFRKGAIEPPDSLGLAEERYYLTGMERMTYAAAAVGTSELIKGPRRFEELAAPLGFYTACNVKYRGRPVAPPSIIRRCGQLRVGIVGVYDPPAGRNLTPQADARVDSFEIREPVEAAIAEIDRLRPSSDAQIVVGLLSESSIRRLLASGRSPLAIVCLPRHSLSQQIGPIDPSVPRIERTAIRGRTLVLYTRATRYGISEATLHLDREHRLLSARSEDVSLDESIRDDPDEHGRLTSFYASMLRGSMEAIADAPFAGDSIRMRGGYAGAATCKSCHEAQYVDWKSTPHASAYKTLLDRHRHFQPRCVSCHVVGYGAKDGFRILGNDTRLAGVQCEVCHGPGAAHATDPLGHRMARQVGEEVCLKCHTPEHSDRFVYAERLPLVVHKVMLISGNPP